MVSKDYFEREVEKIALALKHLLGILPGLKQSGNLEEATAVVQSELEKLFSINTSDLVTASKEQFENRVGQLNGDYLRELGNLLFELTEIEKLKDNTNDLPILIERTRYVFELSITKSKTAHFETLNKLEKLI